MRVALCLSGFTRSVSVCWNSIHRLIIEANPTCSFDIFVSTWNKNGWWSKFDEKPIHMDGDNPNELEFIRNVIKPNRIIVEEFNDDVENQFQKIGDVLIKKYNLKMRYGRVPNIVGMYYKLNQFTQWIESEGYDCIVRCRMDLFIQHPIILPKNTQGIYYQKKILIDDCLFYGDTECMLQIFKTFDNLDNVLSHCELFESHEILQSIILLQNNHKTEIAPAFSIINTRTGYCKDPRNELPKN